MLFCSGLPARLLTSARLILFCLFVFFCVCVMFVRVWSSRPACPPAQKRIKSETQIYGKTTLKLFKTPTEFGNVPVANITNCQLYHFDMANRFMYYQIMFGRHRSQINYAGGKWNEEVQIKTQTVLVVR